MVPAAGYPMTIGSNIPATPSLLQQTVQSLQEEATESLAETRREAETGDPVAARKLVSVADEQANPSTFFSSWSRPPVGSFLNVKA